MIALITGAGRGLGRAIALELAANGWDLALVSRTPAPLAEVVALTNGLAIPADVSDPAAVESAFAHVQSHFGGGPDALVNCAGTGSFAPVEETAPEEWERILKVNLTGTFLCCRQAIPIMRAQGGGQIINVLSVAAKVAFPGAAAYCASKWGALGLTKVLAEEVRRDWIRVIALCPGSIATPFWEGVQHSLNPADMLRPEDVAATVRFLLEQPRGITTDEMVVMPPKGIL